MPALSLRRQACPQTVLHLWDAIAYIRQQKQIPNKERLQAYMRRVYGLESEEFGQQLEHAIADGLVLVKRSKGCKGSKVGIEQDGFRVPDDIPEHDGHDWYCFECHLGGEVMLCTKCHRVFHPKCLAPVSPSGQKPEDHSSEPFVCSVCKQNSDKFSLTLKKTELNILLGFTCIRLKEKTKELHRIPHPDEERWRHDFLVYKPIDLVAMEDKMKSNEYARLSEFYVDAQQIVHNVILYFGMHNRIAEMARQMLGDCEYDLLEIVQCRNCYRMSNMKNDPLWFCQPCEVPHELVYAKLKGFPYWPAKVIKKQDGFYDVRFFGAFHQRALIAEEFVKPIEMSSQKLNIKKTPSFERAYKELKHHQNLVEQKGKQASDDSSKSISIKENSPVVLESSKLPRKRKSISNETTTGKQIAPTKKPASVPIKKNKKFYQESPTSSSPKGISLPDVPVSEDHNLVTSSSQDVSVHHISVAVQTPDELLEKDKLEKPKGVDSGAQSCDCRPKYEQLLKDLQTRLDMEHAEDKAKALKEFSDQLHKELETQHQLELANRLEALHRERREAEQQRETHQKEIRKLTEQHSTELSECKKKQWCYNCECEAIYHCCWNTSYCSVECQQVHWHKEHKRTCRRKR